MPAINVPNSQTSSPKVKAAPNSNTASPHKKQSLTSSLTNMMASLDSSFRGVEGRPVGAVLPEDDDVSIRSDGSSDSENFVMISQGDDSVRDSFEATLFAVHSASVSASPVEFALEVTEDMDRARSEASGSGMNTPRAPSSEPPELARLQNAPPASVSSGMTENQRVIPQPPREGMVRVIYTLVQILSATLKMQKTRAENCTMNALNFLMQKIALNTGPQSQKNWHSMIGTQCRNMALKK